MKRRVIIGFIVLILLNLWGLLKVNSLRQDLDSLRGDIYNQYNDMRTSLSSINTTVEETLKKQGSILSDFSYSVEGIDVENKTISINLKGTPKVYKEGLKFYFNYDCSNGDMLDVLVEAQDTYGFKYKYYSMTVINNNGTLNKWEYSGGNAAIQVEP